MYLNFRVAGESYFFDPTLVYVTFDFEKSAISPRRTPRIGQQPIRFASFHTPTDHSYGQHAQIISGDVVVDACRGEKKNTRKTMIPSTVYSHKYAICVRRSHRICKSKNLRKPASWPRKGRVFSTFFWPNNRKPCTLSKLL